MNRMDKNDNIEESLNDLIKKYSFILMAENTRSANKEDASDVCTDKDKEIRAKVAKRFKLVTDKTIENDINSIEPLYRKWFWLIYCKFCLTANNKEKENKNDISDEIIERLLNANSICVLNLLENIKTAKRYSSVITKYLKNNIRYAYYLIIEYLGKENQNGFHYYFPDALTKDDRTDLINKYIDLDDVNSSALYILTKTKGNEQLPCTAKLRLKAQRRYQEIISRIPKDTIYTSEIEIEFCEQDNPVKIYMEKLDPGRKTYYSYDSKWILRNINNQNLLLENFVGLFKFVDQFYRWQHTGKKYHQTWLDLLTNVNMKRSYYHSHLHVFKEMLGDLQIRGYRSFLRKNNVSIEKLVQWFFHDYLCNTFDAKGFSFNIPREGDDILGQCRDIAIETDSILKQFKLFCEDGVVDHDLFTIYTEHMVISKIPSLIENKYIYVKDSNLLNILNLLFSDQSTMLYQPEKDLNYRTSFEILKQGTVCFSDLQEYQQKQVQILVKNDILYLDDNMNLVSSSKMLELLHDLYDNEFLCSKYLSDYSVELDILRKNDLIKYESSLLAIPEQEYFDYIFNNASFDDSRDLRNKYAHGTQSSDQNVMFDDYVTMLRLLILIVLKINEEFCLKLIESNH